MKFKIKFVPVWLFLILTARSEASFDENTHRYLTSYEVFDTLSQILPYIKDATCGIYASKNAAQGLNVLAALGENVTITGSPIAQGPSQGTVSWISRCIGEVLHETKIAAYNNSDFEKIFADPSIMISLQGISSLKTDGAAQLKEVLLQKWVNYPELVQRDLIAYFVFYYLGSDEVIKDFGLIQDADDFRNRLFVVLSEDKNQLGIIAIRKLVINLVLRDEFLSY